MKRISKTHPPQELSDWIQLQKNQGLQYNYSILQGKPEHKILKEALLKEQGCLCAYTGIRINLDSAHIEHLKPQTQCTDDETVDYRNVVACFPKDGGDRSYGYGAPIKGSWWDQSNFVSPCSQDCERRFSYTWSGHVTASMETDQAAKTTIETLGLDSDGLKERRHRAIMSFFGFSQKAKPLSDKEADFLLRQIRKQDAAGKYKEFCVVFEQLLPKYIKPD